MAKTPEAAAVKFDWDNISDIVLEHAARRPGDEAVRAGQQALTWEQLAVSVENATAVLDGYGIGEGETVGLALANTIEHAIILLGLVRLGATPLGFPPETSAERIAATLRERNVRVLFREPQERQPLAPLTIALPPHWRPTATGRPLRSIQPGERLQVAFLSSGSTGTPRTITLTHEALLRRARLSYPVYADWWSQERPGTALIANSIAHAAFIQWWLQQMIGGGRTVFLPSYVRGGDLIRDVAQWGDAVLRTVPNTCRLFLQAAPAEGWLFPRMRFLNCTGLPLHPDEKRALTERVSPHFSEDYGATGAGPITCLDPRLINDKAESVGRPPAAVEIRLRDGLGNPVATGMAGRIEVRSPGMVPPSVQEQCAHDSFEGFAGGWYRTGDVGRLDTDGFLHFVGRVGQSIHQNGIELFPEEIEAVLTSFTGIADAAVVGHTPPGRGGEIAVAVIGGLDYGQRFAVEAHCAAHLPPERRPAGYLFTDSLPHTANGKIDRPALKAYLATHPAILAP